MKLNPTKTSIFGWLEDEGLQYVVEENCPTINYVNTISHSVLQSGAQTAPWSNLA